MSILEYALDIQKDVSVVLKECKKLGIAVNKEDDLLDDDAIIMLDNAFASTFEETTEPVEDLDDLVEEIMEQENIKIDDTVKKEKLPKKKDVISNKSREEYNAKKKAMYKHKEKLMTNKEENRNIISYQEGMNVASLAKQLEVSPTEIIKKLMGLGLMLTLNSPMTYESAELIVLDYGKEIKREEALDETNFESFEAIDAEEDLVLRAPVVTIMGHVDHGKTTLLDTIRSAHVVLGEAGGITQHIGAYQIDYKGNKVTFIDTPGHAAFTEMRARGASITDIVVVIVAADDGVMPQTKEAIDHAKAAGVPIIVAINKMDKPNINPERVMSELAELGLTPDSWGGDTVYVKLSAKTGDNIDELLEDILLISEMKELKANPSRYALGTVIEAKVDKSVGSIVSLLIQNGTLRLGDPIVVGTTYGKVRTLKNDNGENIVAALPSTPVEITGLNGVPQAGDKFMAFESEKQARATAEQRLARTKQTVSAGKVSLEDLFSKIQSGIKEINVVLKADVKGSEEAVKNSLQKIDVEGVRVKVIRSGVGTVSESDITLANASNAIIIGFNVRPSNAIIEEAKNYGVDIRLYNIIYKVVEEMEDAMKGMLDPEYEENVLGTAEVRKLFKFSKVGMIAGSYITNGIVKANAKVRVIRDGIVVYDGKIGSIQREKDQVKEVKNGLECGITIENFNDIKEKDVLEAYEIVEKKRA